MGKAGGAPAGATNTDWSLHIDPEATARRSEILAQAKMDQLATS